MRSRRTDVQVDGVVGGLITRDHTHPHYHTYVELIHFVQPVAHLLANPACILRGILPMAVTCVRFIKRRSGFALILTSRFVLVGVFVGSCSAALLLGYEWKGRHLLTYVSHQKILFIYRIYRNNSVEPTVISSKVHAEVTPA